MKYLNVSIDDVSPHPESSIKVLDRCFEIIKVFPDPVGDLIIPLCFSKLCLINLYTIYNMYSHNKEKMQ